MFSIWFAATILFYKKEPSTCLWDDNNDPKISIRIFVSPISDNFYRSKFPVCRRYFYRNHLIEGVTLINEEPKLLSKQDEFFCFEKC